MKPTLRLPARAAAVFLVIALAVGLSGQQNEHDRVETGSGSELSERLSENQLATSALRVRRLHFRRALMQLSLHVIQRAICIQ